MQVILSGISSRLGALEAAVSGVGLTFWNRKGPPGAVFFLVRFCSSAQMTWERASSFSCNEINENYGH